MCLAPLTNVSSWIESPLIKEKVSSIWIMGGNIPSSKVTSAEFNFEYDPIAASQILSAPTEVCKKIYIVPIQTCDEDLPSDDLWPKVIECAKEGRGIISNIIQLDPNYDNVKYDSLCVFAYLNQSSIEVEEMCVFVDPTTGIVSRDSGVVNGSDELRPIKFITKIDLAGQNGFISHLCKAIEEEENIYMK